MSINIYLVWIVVRRAVGLNRHKYLCGVSWILLEGMWCVGYKMSCVAIAYSSLLVFVFLIILKFRCVLESHLFLYTIFITWRYLTFIYELSKMQLKCVEVTRRWKKAALDIVYAVDVHVHSIKFKIILLLNENISNKTTVPSQLAQNYFVCSH